MQVQDQHHHVGNLHKIQAKHHLVQIQVEIEQLELLMLIRRQLRKVEIHKINNVRE